MDCLSLKAELKNYNLYMLPSKKPIEKLFPHKHLYSINSITVTGSEQVLLSVTNLNTNFTITFYVLEGNYPNLLQKFNCSKIFVPSPKIVTEDETINSS